MLVDIFKRGGLIHDEALGVPVTHPQPRKIWIDVILIIVWLVARQTGHGTRRAVVV